MAWVARAQLFTDISGKNTAGLISNSFMVATGVNVSFKSIMSLVNYLWRGSAHSFRRNV